MQNTFNSNNELWTELALSGGGLEVLAGADSLSARAQSELNDIKAEGVAGSYLKHAQVNRFLYWLKWYMEMEPGAAD